MKNYIYNYYIKNSNPYIFSKNFLYDNLLDIKYYSLLYFDQNKKSFDNSLDELSYEYFKIEIFVREIKNKVIDIKNKILKELKKSKQKHYKNKYITIRMNNGYINNILKLDIKNNLLKNNPEYFNITKVNEHLIIKINKQGAQDDKNFNNKN